MTATVPKSDRHFTSSILLWMRTDQPRQAGMDRWKGPHAQIIAASPGLEEYRQIHMAESNAGRWPAAAGVETRIPGDRRIDGVAEVTFENALAPLAGRTQTALAFEDEVNIFRRTLLHAGPPGTSRWYPVAPGERPGSRAVLLLRRRGSEGSVGFHAFVKKQLAPALAGTGVLKELRTQVFLPWNEKTWDTPNVAHDNPKDQHLHASVVLGFAGDAERDVFFAEEAPALSALISPHAAAIHAYDVAETLTFVAGGAVLPHAES